jgi:hypothetical protein
MSATLSVLFHAFRRADISYCLLRDAERLDELARGGELDLLVDPRHLTALSELLTQHGFIRIAAWGHAPHRFFLHYDEAAGTWLKCDVVTEAAFGRPVHHLRTGLGTECLANRRPVGPTFAPSPEEELVTLLIHCVVDKGRFTPERISRLKALRSSITRDDDVSRHLARYWLPSMTWPRMAEMIDRDRWEDLLASRRPIVQTLARRARVRTAVLGVRDRVFRKVQRLAGLFRPPAPSIALLAPDGAGKSTLTAGIRDSFPFPVTTVYMGLYQDRRRSRWSRMPGLGLAVNLGTQWRRYLTARARQAAGHLVVFDRYTFDALLPTSRRLTAVGRLRRWLLARSCPAPDLVVVLDAPGDVLYARKQEHDPIVLERQRQAYLQMGATIPGVAVVDATADADGLRQTVMALVWQLYRHKRSRGLPRTHAPLPTTPRAG